MHRRPAQLWLADSAMLSAAPTRATKAKQPGKRTKTLGHEEKGDTLRSSCVEYPPAILESEATPMKMLLFVTAAVLSQVTHPGLANTVSPFGYGAVGQYLVLAADPAQTGAQWCASKFGSSSNPWRCLNVSGGGQLTSNACASTVPAQEIVSCSPFQQIQSFAATNTAPGQTGQWWCDLHFGLNLGGAWQCLSVAGSPGACSADVTLGQSVSCGQYHVVHDAGFQYPGFLSTPEPFQIPSGSGSQSGQAWCDTEFSIPQRTPYVCTSVDLGGSCSSAPAIGSYVSCAQAVEPITLTSPIPAGQSPQPGQTGSWLCSQTAINQQVYGSLSSFGWQCIGMKDSNGNELPASACPSTLIASGSVAYCQATNNGNIVEAANCENGSGLSPLDQLFCPVNQVQNWPDGLFGYGSLRRNDTYYLFNDYVRVGVNTAFGGTIFELYGVDMRNRILEAGGGALQLSLYADDPSTVSAPSECYLSGSTTCQSTALNADGTCPANYSKRQPGAAVANCKTTFACNGTDAGFPWNPVQSQSAITPSGSNIQQCAYDPTASSLDSIKAGAKLTVRGNPPTSTALAFSKKNPYQFSKNLTFNGLTWTQTTTVLPNVPYVKLTYTINWLASSTTTNGTAGVSSGAHELPALFLKQSFSDANVVFSETPQPYTDPNGALNCTVTPSATCIKGKQEIFLEQPVANVTPDKPSDQPYAVATEGWASVCDPSTQPACMTVLTFTPNLAIEWQPATAPTSDNIYGGAAYLGIYGYFNMKTSYTGSFTVFVFPYNYNDTVAGLTVRQWINKLKLSN